MIKLDVNNVITKEILFFPLLLSSGYYAMFVFMQGFSKFKPQNPGFRLESLKKLIFYSFSIKKQQGAKITTPPNQMKVKPKKGITSNGITSTENHLWDTPTYQNLTIKIALAHCQGLRKKSRISNCTQKFLIFNNEI